MPSKKWNKEEIIAKVNALVKTGMTKTKALEQLKIPYSTYSYYVWGGGKTKVKAKRKYRKAKPELVTLPAVVSPEDSTLVVMVYRGTPEDVSTAIRRVIS